MFAPLTQKGWNVEPLRHERIHWNLACVRYGRVLGWCHAMRWTYVVQGWSKARRRALDNLIKKLEKVRPDAYTLKVTVDKLTATQVELLRWACEQLGIEPR